MKVGVALSGGKDSSLTAAILKTGGHEVKGFHLLLTPDEYGEIPVDDEIEVVRKLCRLLEIKLEIIDLRDRFRTEIIEKFVRDYRDGLTPNPCVLCNRFFKFGVLLDRARADGCEKVASGHYARIVRGVGGYLLKKGSDPARDESYFLGQISRSILPDLIFPLGEGTEEGNLRLFPKMLAGYRPLPISREACFVGKPGLKNFEKLNISDESPGRRFQIIDEEGRRLGETPAGRYYTIGQRRGLGPAAGGEGPLYVLKILPEAKRLIVGPRSRLFRDSCPAREVNWLIPVPDKPLTAEVKIRYTHRGAPARITPRDEEGEVMIEFEEPQFSLTPGQLAVFYREDMLIGSAWIMTGSG